MDPEVIFIDTDSDSDPGDLSDGTATGFFVTSKQEQLDEPVEVMPQSSSVSMPDLPHSNFEASVSDSVAAIPAAASPATEPEKLQSGFASRSPILEKFMRTSHLFEKTTVSDECSVLEKNSGVTASLNAVFDSDCTVSTLQRYNVSGHLSDENSEIVRLSCGISSAKPDIGSLSQCFLREKSNCDSNFSEIKTAFIDDPKKNSVPDAAARKIQLREVASEEASEPSNEMHLSKIKDADRDKSGGDDDDDDDDDDLPRFLDVHQISKQVKQPLKRKGGNNLEEESMDVGDEAEVEVPPVQKIASYSIDQLLADHKETARLRAMVADLKTEPSASNESPSQEDLLPEHKKELERMSVVENEIRDVHPGETVFVHSNYQSLFAYPESLTLTSCGFRPGQSRTDQRLATLPPDDLLEFLDPEFIDLVFPAISSKETFLQFIYYLLSVSPDSRVSHRLHRIVHRVLHGRKTTWTPSTLDVCRVLVNYGASLTSLCQDISLVNFSERDLAFVKHGACKNSSSPNKENSTQTFELENLKFLLQLLTDALAVRPGNYSYSDCLALTLILFRVSLDHRLSVGELHLDLEMFFAAVINAVPPDAWKNWVRDLCLHAVGITKDHHNMVYLTGLLPLVERGAHLQRVLSLVFMHKYLPHANCFDDLLEPKVQHSLNFLETLRFNDKESDFYLTWSLINLLEYSIGSEALPEEDNDFAVLVNCLQLKISKIKDYINKVDHILLKDLMVLLTSKWNIMARTTMKKELFASASGPVAVQSISSEAVNDSDEETTTDSR